MINLVDDAFIELNSGNSEADVRNDQLKRQTQTMPDCSMTYQRITGLQDKAGTYSQLIRLADAVADGNSAKDKSA